MGSSIKFIRRNELASFLPMKPERHVKDDMSTAIFGRERVTETSVAPARRSVSRLLEPLHEMAEDSKHIISKSFGLFESQGRQYSLPRYVFLGPKGGGETI